MRIELDVRTTDGIAELSEGIGAISSVADALDLLAEVFGLGTSRLILHAEQLTPAFFDLRTGLAGEILQKCANYQIRVAIVGDFSGYTSKSLHAFIVECNRGRHIFFCASRERGHTKIIGWLVLSHRLRREQKGR